MKKSLAVLAGLSIFAVSGAYAGCVDTYGIGAKATAMGGAYTAYANDPFAVHYNPAGLSQITRPTIAAGVHVIDPDLTIKGYDTSGSVYHDDYVARGMDRSRFGDDFPLLVVPHMGFAMPINEKFSFGIAGYVPFGLETRWPKGQAGVYDSFHSYYERLVVTPTLSYKVNEKLAIGVGISLGYSKSGAEKWMHYFENDTGRSTAEWFIAAVQGGFNPLTMGPLDPSTTKGQEAISTAGSLGSALVMDGSRIDAEMDDKFNYGFNVGIMYKPVETITLGLTYRSHTQAKFSGDLKLTTYETKVLGVDNSSGTPTPILLAPGTHKGKVRMQYDHPQQIQAGIRYQPHERFSMEFDIVWTNWSYNERQTETLTIFGNSNTVSYARKWDDTRQIRFGAEYVVNDWLTLRGGYFYDPTPIPDDTLDLMWPDADKKTYSFGAGFNITPNLTIDTVLQLTHVEQDRIIGGESVNMNHAHEGFDGDLKMKTPKIGAKASGYLYGAGVTVSYRF